MHVILLNAIFEVYTAMKIQGTVFTLKMEAV
jgi:hypothetical protein